MKPARSLLIERFLDHVADGLIAADGASSGVAVLLDTVAALRRILDGAEPDEALEVDRTTNAGKPWTLDVAFAIHSERARGTKWAVVHALTNEYLARIGEAPITLSRVKALPKEQAEAIARRENIATMMAAIRSALRESGGSLN